MFIFLRSAVPIRGAIKRKYEILGRLESTILECPLNCLLTMKTIN